MGECPGTPMSILQSVLVADDEPSIRHVLTLVLQAQGYEVRAVGNGEEALGELAARDYDAVISDVRMPQVDGLTLLPEGPGRQPDLTFVVMSAYGSHGRGAGGGGRRARTTTSRSRSSPRRSCSC